MASTIAANPWWRKTTMSRQNDEIKKKNANVVCTPPLYLKLNPNETVMQTAVATIIRQAGRHKVKIMCSRAGKCVIKKLLNDVVFVVGSFVSSLCAYLGRLPYWLLRWNLELELGGSSPLPRGSSSWIDCHMYICNKVLTVVDHPWSDRSTHSKASRISDSLLD